MRTCAERQGDGNWWEDQIVKRCGFPIGPINTWTNLAYVIAGLFVWPMGLAGKVCAAQLVFLGIGSGAYHGFKTWLTAKMDDAGMYMVYGGLAVYSIAPTAKLTPWLMLVVGCILSWRFAFMSSYDHVERILLGTFIAVILLAVGTHGHLVRALLGAAILGGAYVIWNLDQRKLFPLPKWGHGIWHVLTAIATYILFV